MGEGVKTEDAREWELWGIEDAIYFRTRCAEEYPDDFRNDAAVQQLQEVALPYVQGLADDDEKLLRLAAVYEVEDGLDGFATWRKWDRFGFGMSTDDPAEWLQHRVDEMEEFVQDNLELSTGADMQHRNELRHRVDDAKAKTRELLDGEIKVGAENESIVAGVHEGQHKQYSLGAVLTALWRAEVDGEVVGLCDTPEEALVEAREMAEIMDAEPVTLSDIEAEIARHAEAIRMITEAGVTCLDEVPVEE
jgi:hypothetical protein